MERNGTTLPFFTLRNIGECSGRTVSPNDCNLWNCYNNNAAKQLARDGVSTALELVFCIPGPTFHVEWPILVDLHSSDHNAIKLTCLLNVPQYWDIRTGSANVPNALVPHSYWSLRTRCFYLWIPWWSVSRSLYSKQLRNISPVAHHCPSRTSSVVYGGMSRQNSLSEKL
jgi:hypothetical protein